MVNFSLSLVESGIPTIFDQVQGSAANHRKNAVALYKLQQSAATVTKEVKGGSAVKLVGEKAFGDAFIDAMNRVLIIKKGVVVADRVAKFVGSFVKYMTEKAAENRSEEDEDDTPESRLVARIVKWLLQGFEARDKNVRYRCIQMAGEMISFVGELDESVYLDVRKSLIDRVSDKETFVRSISVVGLSRLLASEDPSDLPAGPTIPEVLSYTMRYDSSAEVRRTALLHLPVTPDNLPMILSRSRDVDPIIRKLLYSSVLATKTVHPRALSISQRERLVKHGLGDREDAVRVAAGKLVSSWYETVTEGVLEFLKLFDVVGPEGNIAVDALLSVFVTLPETLYGVSFDETFWDEISPESALLARVFVQHSLEHQDETRLESSSLPVVTEFAFHIQEMYNSLVDLFQGAEEEDDEDEEEKDIREDTILNSAFILSQMLKVAVKLDYADEIGRRKMFSIIRDILAHTLLPEELVDPAMDVLKELLPSERELVQVVVEVVIDLRDPTGDEVMDDLTHGTMPRERSLKRSISQLGLSQEQKAETDAVDIRCLDLCISMLRRVHSKFEETSVLEGIVADVILPAVKRKEYSMRQKGMLGLGLCCLLSKPMASTSLQLFLGQMQSSPDALKVQLLQTTFDIFLVHQDLAKFATDGGILDLLLPMFETEASEQAQTVICTGLAKMMLSGLINDDRVLTSLVFAYVSPVTSDNEELRQCLAYFLPVYCYSTSINQVRFASTFLSAYYRVCDAHDELEEEEEIIDPLQFGVLFVDWTNPQKAVVLEGAADGTPERRNSHVELAVQILRGLYDEERPDEPKATLCQLIGKVNLPTTLDSHSLLRLNLLVSNVEDKCPIKDKTAAKAFDRFKARFTKQYAEALAQLKETGHDLDDELRNLYEYVGADVPDGEESPQRSRPRVSSPRQSSTPIIPSRVYKQTQKPRNTDSEDSEDEEEEAEEEEKQEIELPSSDAEEPDTRPPSPEPLPKEPKRKKRPPNGHVSSESRSSSEEDRTPEIPSVASSVLVTPKKKNPVKRVRSPGKHADLASPARKKRVRDSSNGMDLFSGTKSMGKNTVSKGRSKLQSESDASEEDSDSE